MSICKKNKHFSILIVIKIGKTYNSIVKLYAHTPNKHTIILQKQLLCIKIAKHKNCYNLKTYQFLPKRIKQFFIFEKKQPYESKYYFK